MRTIGEYKLNCSIIDIIESISKHCQTCRDCSSFATTPLKCITKAHTTTHYE